MRAWGWPWWQRCQIDGISDNMSEGMSVGGVWTYWSLYLYTLDGWFHISFLYIRSSYAETNWRVYFSGNSATRKKHGAFQSVVGVVHQPFAPEWTHHPQMSKRHKLGCFNGIALQNQGSTWFNGFSSYFMTIKKTVHFRSMTRGTSWTMRKVKIGSEHQQRTSWRFSWNIHGYGSKPIVLPCFGGININKPT